MVVVNQAALDVGELSNRLAQGYYSHLAAISIATNPRAIELAPEILPDELVSLGFVHRKDGTQHVFSFLHYLGLIETDSMISNELERVWLTGALLTIGNELAKHQYFDRFPLLELVRHLRNGLAHGNRFQIDHPSRLNKFPAHNRYAHIISDKGTIYEITPAVDGQTVLFDFMGPGDVLDILISVQSYLETIGNKFESLPYF